MKHYLIVWDETDGIDMMVYDTVIKAMSCESALSILSYHIEENLVKNKVFFEDDGSEFGYYFNCEDDCHEECTGHGGITLRTIEGYETEEEAKKEKSTYHTEYTV